MKHCPNPSCPYLREHGVASEFREGAERCLDCGGVLAGGPAPPVARGSSGGGAPRRLWLRLLVTAALATAACLGAEIPMPFPEPAPGGVVLGVGVLGLAPVLTAFVLVEIVLLVLPRWRPLRYRDRRPAAVGRAVAAVALGVAAYQAWGIYRYWELAGLSPGGVPLLLVVAFTGALALAAAAISRFGLGNGYSVLLAAELLPAGLRVGRLSVENLQVGALDPQGIFFLLLIYALVVLVTLRTLAAHRLGMTPLATPFRRRRSEPAPSLPVRSPTSGLLPIVHAGGLLLLLPTLYDLGLDLPEPLSRLYPGLPFFDLAFALLGLLLLVAYTVAFNRPGPAVALWRRADPDGPGPDILRERFREALRRSGARTFVYLLLLVVAQRALHRLAPDQAGLDLLTLSVATAVAADLHHEWRARLRRSDWSPAWRLHRLCALDPLLAALGAAGISTHARATHHRTLLRFFGPYVPVEVWVPAERQAEARSIAARVTSA